LEKFIKYIPQLIQIFASSKTNNPLIASAAQSVLFDLSIMRRSKTFNRHLHRLLQIGFCVWPRMNDCVWLCNKTTFNTYWINFLNTFN